MLYIDTSVIVKLYIKEEHSLNVSNWIIDNNEAIPLTSFHELEFSNAIQLKRFKNEMTMDEVALIMSRFNKHENEGIYYRPHINWSDVFQYAIELSKNYTESTGSRTLDIVHIALAISIKADRFLTFDARQAKIASLTGLIIEDPFSH